MLKLAADLGFFKESLHRRFVTRVEQDLNRKVALQMQIAAFDYTAHAATSNLFEEFEVIRLADVGTF